LKSQFQHALEVPQFRTALDYRRRLTFGIDKLDSILQLHLDDIIGIVGETRHTNALVTRLIVRSLLPHRHGGFDAKKVMVIDADNSSNPYLYVDFARQYRMHPCTVLDKVLVTRQFTVYQLTHTILYDLPKRVHLHRPSVIVVSGLMDQFLQEPNIHINEFGNLISQIVSALRKIKDALLIISSRFGEELVVPTFPRIIEIRAKKEFDETKLNLSVYNNNKMKRVGLTENELNGAPP
jgi:Rad51 protein